MPYRDPQKRREYDRERRRRERATVVDELTGLQKRNSSNPLPVHPTVADLTAIVAEEINRFRGSRSAVLTRARCIGYLAGVLLKAIEVSDIAIRLEELEAYAEELKTEENDEFQVQSE